MVSEAGELLINTADRLFGEIATAARLAKAETNVWLADDWRMIEEAGLPLALVAEDAGGYGFDVVDALAVVRRAGAFAVPFPLAETMIANQLLAESRMELPGGALSIATDGKEDYLRLAREGSKWRIFGELSRVPWGRFVDNIVCVAAHGPDNHLVLLPRNLFSVVEGENLAGEARDLIRVNGILQATQLSGVSNMAPFRLRLAGAAARSIAIAGALDRLLEMTTNYASERIQFGRSIGKFQAIQQYLAIFAGHVAAASASADIAAEAMSGNLAAFPIAIAKTRAGQAATAAAAIAHQVHGAIGITYEHTAQFLTRRLWSWRDEFGSETEWARLVGREVITVGADGFWPLVAAFQ
jgi:acyl-CoA dehydrogenase